MSRRRVLCVAAAFAALLVASDALAHDRRDGWREAYRYGYEVGLRDGIDHGRYDSYRGHFDMRSREYRKADRGYERWMGSKGDYRRGYRDGYERGYRQAFNRHSRGPWGRPGLPGYRRY